jgi:ribonuclease HI
LLEEYFARKEYKPWRSDPFMVCWGIWLARNSTLFGSKFIPPIISFTLIEARLNEYNAMLAYKKKQRCIEPLNFRKDSPWSFFDGASQDNSKRCGVGFILYLNDNVYYRFKSNLGAGSNNWGELMSLFFLLKCAITKNVANLKIFGDSSLVIHFVKGWAQITNLSLANLASQTQRILQLFTHIEAFHIFRELNSEVDSLSK